MMNDLQNPPLADILSRAKSDEFKQWLNDLLLRIMEPDTTIGSDVERMATNEAAVFDLLSQAAMDIGCSQENIERVAIRPDIDQHPAYTTAYYSEGHVEDLSKDVYAGRSNLVIRVPGHGSGGKLVINVHIDTVSPHIVASSDGDVVRGRGAVDDKGGCVAAMGALRLLHETKLSQGDSIPHSVEFQFVIDEEMGGNGSLSMTLEPSASPTAVVVLEPTELQMHPGNRGATWYRVDLDTVSAANISPTDLAFATVLAIEEEGLRIHEESGHALFPDKPVQTNHGILGPVGEHPSSVCDRVDLLVHGSEEAVICRAIDEALEHYCGLYGDKTGDPRLEKHVEIERQEGEAVVRVFGISGHMGAVRECDGAILKAAYIWNALPEDVRVDLVDRDPSETSIVIEGGQGFLPDRSLDSILNRITKAATSGVKALVERRGTVFHEDMVRTSFDKLQNHAFACNVDGPWVQAAVRASEAAGIEVRRPLVGFRASCDARLFAGAFPDAEVITFGPGRMIHAHAADEQVNITDIAQAAATLGTWVLSETI